MKLSWIDFVNVNMMLEEEVPIEYDTTNRLPDDIFKAIISLLSTEDRVRASCASRRWKSFCYPLSILDLNLKTFSRHSSLNDTKKQFCNFVNCITALFLDKEKNLSLKEFRLSIDVSDFQVEDKTVVDGWIRSGMIIDSSILDLGFFEGEPSTYTTESGHHYRLPVSPVPRLPRIMEELKLRGCKFLPMSYNTIKTVVLNRVDCSGESLFSFIGYCGALEGLYLQECILPLVISFENPNSKLKLLKISETTTYGLYHELRINIPTLLNFVFEGELLLGSFGKKPTKPVEVDLNIKRVFKKNAGDVDDDAGKIGVHLMLRKLLNQLDNIVSLNLSVAGVMALTDESKDIYSLMMEGHRSHSLFPPPLPILKTLTVKMFRVAHHLNVMCLIRGCPNLEVLVIDFSNVRLFFLGGSGYEEMSATRFVGADEKDTVQLISSKYLPHLKKVEIFGFEGRYYENIFIKCTLANANALEKMIIHEKAMNLRTASVKREGSEEDLENLITNQLKTKELLMAFTRGSSNAQLIFL